MEKLGVQGSTRHLAIKLRPSPCVSLFAYNRKLPLGDSAFTPRLLLSLVPWLILATIATSGSGAWVHSPIIILSSYFFSFYFFSQPRHGKRESPFGKIISISSYQIAYGKCSVQCLFCVMDFSFWFCYLVLSFFSVSERSNPTPFSFLGLSFLFFLVFLTILFSLFAFLSP